MADLSARSERFRIDGNKLVVTALFDPRYQRGAEGELLNTLQGMLDEVGGDGVVLDLHLRPSLPSMLVGIIAESCRRVSELGKTLTLRIRPEHRRSLDWAGMQRLFDEGEERADDDGIVYIEYVGKQQA